MVEKTNVIKPTDNSTGPKTGKSENAALVSAALL